MCKKVLAFLLALSMVLGLSVNSFAATKPTAPPARKQLTVTQIAQKSASVVLLNIYDDKGNLLSTGSGFIASANGKIVTNYHVIDGAYKVEAVTSDNKKYVVNGIVNYNKSKDLAVVSIYSPKPFPFLALGDSSKIQLGESVVAIGSPLGLKNTVSTGIVSSLRQNLFRDVKGCTDIQISAPISYGSSGGALFNTYGDVIGVTYAGIVEGENLNFAIPINEVKPLMNPGLIPLKPITQENKISDGKWKSYILIIDEYSSLALMGSQLTNLYFQMYLALDSIAMKADNSLLNSVTDALNNLVDIYDKQSDYIKNLIDIIPSNQVDISPIKTILKSYSAAIESYKLSIDNLNSCKLLFSDTNIDNFCTNTKAAIDSTLEGLKLCDSEYTKLFKSVTQYR